jgi:hypothetical protein
MDFKLLLFLINVVSLPALLFFKILNTTTSVSLFIFAFYNTQFTTSYRDKLNVNFFSKWNGGTKLKTVLNFYLIDMI